MIAKDTAKLATQMGHLQLMVECVRQPRRFGGESLEDTVIGPQ